MVVSRSLIGLLTVCLVNAQLVFAPAAQAAMVSTDTLITETERAGQEAAILNALAQDRAREVLARQGISLAQVEQRLQRLSHAEIRQLADRTNNLEAGEGALEVVLVVFLVLILLDLLGTTDIFPNI